MKTLLIDVYGRVQGVNFRNTVKHSADGLGLCGMVQNKEDGSVEIVAQGGMSRLSQLINWIKSSPGFSKVEKIEKKEIKINKKYEDFRVLRNGSFLSDQRRSFLNLAGYLKRERR